ncbi:rhodanese-like domain-containing protein [Paenibacillus sp. GCM10027626]|uniref:rhodanese-like domain-containing protein n=1 Tax=Paenibacillus sp. GCM10027626 TaxID=3273411 RepID=UPI0036432D2E
MENWEDIEPQQLAELLAAEAIEREQIFDVRERHEYDYYHLDGSVLMPTSTFIERCNELPQDKPLYIICAHGIRSVAVCRYLSGRGYDNLHNVIGGMAAVAAIYGFQYD